MIVFQCLINIIKAAVKHNFISKSSCSYNSNCYNIAVINYMIHTYKKIRIHAYLKLRAKSRIVNTANEMEKIC